MNANAKFLKEARELEARWAQNGELKKMMNAIRGQTAVLLEGQRLWNETNICTCGGLKLVTERTCKKCAAPKVCHCWAKEGF